MFSMTRSVLVFPAFSALILICSAAAPVISPAKFAGGYIVEFEEAVALQRAPSFFSNLSASHIGAVPRLELSHDLFNGASFVIDSAHNNQSTIDTIQSFSIVKSIWPIQLYTRPAANLTVVKDSSIFSPAALKAIQKRGVGEDTYPVHVMGGVDKLRAEGYSGEGLHIAIVDTGVDYTHPALGGGYGPGYKISYAIDLVGDDYDGTNTPVPDGDPMDCLGHGTHVAGIIGANTNKYGFTGVVPNATLGVYKVFGCADNVGTDILIKAFVQAFEDGADVITSSIGGRNGFSQDPWNIAVDRIVAAGTPCTIAAGNDGQWGFFTTSGAGDAISAIAVGSVDNIDYFEELVTGEFSLNSTDLSAFGYLPGVTYGDFGNLSAPLYAVGFDINEPAEACSPLDPDTPDLSSYIVLVRRGTCSFDEKVANVKLFGATKVMFYNNAGGIPVAPATTVADVPTGMVDNLQGEKWNTALSAGLEITLIMTESASANPFIEYWPNDASGGKMSYFSSWGPTFEMYIKPAIAAPGGSILSTLPLSIGGWGVYSGTSMATPYVAGVVALIKQVQGKNLSPQEIISRLSTTGALLGLNDQYTTYPNLAPVIQQGGGLVDAHAAAHSKTTLDIDIIALNDTKHFQAPHSFKIQNSGSTPVTYTLSNIGALTVLGIYEKDSVPESFLPAMIEANATIRFVPSTITIPGNGAATVTAHFTRPAGLDEGRLPIYGGYIGVSGSNGEFLTLPYAGAAAELRNTAMMAGGYGAYLVDSSTENDVTDFNFTFAGPGSSYVPARYPVAAIGLSMGSPLVRVDIIPRDVHGLPRFVGEQSYGPVPGTPWLRVPRQMGYEVSWNGRLDNGDYVPGGEYRFLVRPLRLFGDETRVNDYEEEYTPYFWISYV